MSKIAHERFTGVDESPRAESMQVNIEKGGLVALAISAIRYFMPPPNHDVLGQQRWRWKVFSGLAILAVGLILHILWACGYLAPAFPGFATQTQLQTVGNQMGAQMTALQGEVKTDNDELSGRVTVIGELLIRTSIRAKALQGCTTKDDDLKRELSDEIDDLERKYQKLTGGSYSIPPCGDL